MYDSLFCRVYNEFGWNEYPRVFGEELLNWLRLHDIEARSALDLGCGTGVLCETLAEHGIDTLGVDLSGDMIAIAKERAPRLSYDVADMVRFTPDRAFNLVTCTGDALNHVTDAGDVRQVFRNAWAALNPGGLFVFDLLRDDEVPEGEPFEAPFPDGLTVRFSATRDSQGFTALRIEGYKNDALQFHEEIREKLYDVNDIRAMLEETGFRVIRCADHLVEKRDAHGTTWFIVAKKETIVRKKGAEHL